MIDIEVTVDGLDEFLNRIPDGPRREAALGSVLDKGRFIIQQHVMEEEPVRTGFTRRNTTSDFDGHLTAHLVVAGGGVFADTGAAPHQIAATAARMLRFVPQGGANPRARLTGRARVGQEGEYVFAFVVNHPGQAAQNYLQRALDLAVPEWEPVMAQALQEMIGES